MKNLLLKKVRFFVKKLSFMVMLLTISSGLAFSQSTITVTTNADDGDGSLRKAIADAVDGDLIVFSGVDSIALGEALSLGDKTLTIDGTTAGADVILDGRLFSTEADSNRVITVMGADDKTVKLMNLTVQYGNVNFSSIAATDSLNQGGGLFVDNSDAVNASFIAMNCIFQNNTAVGRGGGVFSKGNNLFENCSFLKNSTTDPDDARGGGAAGHFTVFEGCTFAGNYSADKGGGVMVHEGSLANNCVIDGNSSFDSGGGVLTEEYGVITNSIIENNFTEDSGADGGGLYLNRGHASELTVRNNTVVDYGAGVYVNNDSWIKNSTISDNESTDDRGGGIHIDDDGGLVDNCIITGNIAYQHGGGVFIKSGGIVRNSTITGNTCGGNGSGDGAGIALDEIKSLVENCIISNNISGDHGGGVMIQSGTVINCTIDGNESADDGGGVNIDDKYPDSPGQLIGCVITNNSAADQGGGVYVLVGNIINCDILNNTAANGDGVRGKGTWTVKNSILYGNTTNDVSTSSNTEVVYVMNSALTAGHGLTTEIENSIDLVASPFVGGSGADSLQLADMTLADAGTTAGGIADLLPKKDIAGNQRVAGSEVDMGAFESYVLVTGLDIDLATLDIGVTRSAELAVTFTPAQPSNIDLTWGSLDESIVTVENGVVTGVSLGTAKVWATSVLDPLLTDTCEVTVDGSQILNIDMKGSGLPVDGRVFVSGGAWGWPQPGSNADLELFDADGDSIFSVTLTVCPQFWPFKFFINPDWNTGEPVSKDRTHVFAPGEELSFVWGEDSNVASTTLPATFESLNDLAWSAFEQGPNADNCSDVSIVANPDVTGINTSASALQFVVRPDAQPWAGAYSANYGTLTFTDDFHTLTMMVYKTVISPVALKLENSTDGGPVKEIKVSNTKINEWELLTFDFEDVVGYSYPQLVFFPDFPDTRTAGTTVLLDNIGQFAQTAKVLNVDMRTDANYVLGDRVFVAGGAWGWAGPGDNPDLEMFDADGDSIFTVSVTVCANMWPFKFFRNTGWANGEPVSADRFHIFTSGNENLSFVWGEDSNDVPQDNPLPATFESTSDMTWTTFELGGNADVCSDFTIAANPDVTGINTSANALRFVVRDDAALWAGAWSSSFVPVEFTQGLHTLSMMVYKDVISPTALKVENSSNGGPVTEVKVSNTVVNEWELLKFDFSSVIGYSYPNLVIFPDFPDPRTSGSIVYLDNIAETVSTVGLSSESAMSVMVYPNPVTNELNVTFSSANAKVEIYNSVGRKIEEVIAEGNKVTFDVSNYVRGLYFVKINNEKVVKFVK